jgi:hypothetical protein
VAIFGKSKLGDPVRASARVVSSSRPPHNARYSPLQMDLVVQADGVPPTAVQFKQRAARCAKFPVPGQVIPVEIERSDPTKVKVLWDEVPSRGELGQQQSQAIAAAMRGDVPAPVDPQGPGAPPGVPPQIGNLVDQIRQAFPGAEVNVAEGSVAPSGGDDRIAKLERLAQLHRSGVLSDEELAREKSRILDEG